METVYASTRSSHSLGLDTLQGREREPELFPILLSIPHRKKNLAFSKETRKYRISTRIKLSIFQRNIFCSSVKKQGNFIIYLTLGDRYQLPKTLNATGITTKAFLRMVMIHNYLSHGFCKETIQRIFISLLSCERSELHLFNKMTQEHF